MDVIIGGRRFITNDPRLIEGAFEKGAVQAAAVEGRRPGEINLGNKIERSGFKGELNRKPSAERR